MENCVRKRAEKRYNFSGTCNNNNSNNHLINSNNKYGVSEMME